MFPLISIIVTVYNVEKYLKTCLDSILCQTYKKLEIIIIEDGATDGSAQICDEYGKKDARIVVIHKANEGLSDARNRGIEIATGELISFIDGDDIISSNMIDLLYDVMVDTKSDIAICDPVHIFRNEDIIFVNSNMKFTFNPNEAITELWYQKSFLPSACGKLYAKRLFKTLRFKAGIIFEDIEVMHKIFSEANKIVYTPSRIYGYVHRENSITTLDFSKKDVGIIDISEELLKFTENKSSKLRAAAKSYYLTSCLRIYLNAPRSGEYEDAIKLAISKLNKYGKSVLSDKNIRRKTRYGLIIYFYFRPLMKIIYKKTNRWK